MNKQILTLLVTAGTLAGSVGASADTNVVSGILRGEVNWSSTNEYVLDGYVYVADGAVLNIEAGTVVRGKPGAAPSFGALFVTRGGKINALGTRLRPIIFTAESDDIADPFDIPLEAEPTGRGLWGGVVLLGKARLNRPDAEASGSGLNPDGSFYQLYEGLSDASDAQTSQSLHRFGGNDDDDSSGTLRFVSIRYAGKALESNKEINGLSMGGVGRGTTLEFVEVYGGGDDGFEWWGGTVNSRYLVSAYNSDELFDMDQGHSGHHQFWFGLQAISGDEGMELNGQPSGGPNANIVGAQPLGEHQIFNATLIGEGGAGSGSDVMNTRSEYYGQIHNSVFLEFQGKDVTSSVANNYGLVSHNLFWNNAGDRGTVGSTNAPTELNPEADPRLMAIDRAQDELLDPRPQAGSPVFNDVMVTPANGHFCPAPYKGAFDANDNWLLGWTALYQNLHLRQKGVNTITVSGILRGENHWSNTNEYVLDGYVYVAEGAVLNIEAGTVVRGKPGAAPSFGALFVTRGGKLNAIGSASNPIIFTAESDDIADPFDIPLEAEPTGRGLWGGVVLLGKARLNRPDAEASGSGLNPDGSFYQLYEGLSDASDAQTSQSLHRFGGNDDDDSSGTLRFVSIRYAGKALESNKEINGLSMGGVGRGTTLEFVEVYGGGDDGFEWWGGTVNSRYLVSAYNSDELFDMDQGHSGHHQFWFGLQAISGDEGMELNGQPSGGPNANIVGAQPLGEHQIFNATLIGEGGAGSGSDVMNTRSEYYGQIHNSVFLEFQGKDVTSSVANNYGLVSHNLFWNNAGDRGTVGSTNAPTELNPEADPRLMAIDRAQDELLDPRPQAGSPVFSEVMATPTGGFFSAAAYKGAFRDALWCQDWTALADNQHLVLSSKVIVCDGETNPPAPIHLSVTREGNNLVLSWSGSGDTYTVVKKADLGESTWTTVGTTSAKAYTVPIEAGNAFFQVIIP